MSQQDLSHRCAYPHGNFSFLPPTLTRVYEHAPGRIFRRGSPQLRICALRNNNNLAQSTRARETRTYGPSSP